MYFFKASFMPIHAVEMLRIVYFYIRKMWKYLISLVEDSVAFGFNTTYNKNKRGQREESVANRSEMSVKTPAHLELSMMLCRRCAMVRTVQWENSLRMVVWIKSSVSRSTAAVASSRIKMRDFLNRARARHNSCLCPTLWKEWHVLKMWF